MDAAAQKAEFVVEQFGKAAEFYDLSPFFPLCGQRLVELAELPSGSRVLDIACGTGAVLFSAAERVGPMGHVTGIDIAGPMVARANAEIARRKVMNAEAREMNAETLDFPDASFDAALCGFALWFIPNLDHALSEIRRVLRPGARFSVSTWGPLDNVAKRYQELFSWFGGRQPELESHSLSTAASLVRSLQAAEFDVLHTSGEDVSVVYADEDQWWMQRMARPHVNEASLAPDVLPRFKRDCFEMLQEFRHPDGFHETRNAVFAVARKPT